MNESGGRGGGRESTGGVPARGRLSTRRTQAPRSPSLPMWSRRTEAMSARFRGRSVCRERASQVSASFSGPEMNRDTVSRGRMGGNDAYDMRPMRPGLRRRARPPPRQGQ
jgi:hypothetical protein